MSDPVSTQPPPAGPPPLPLPLADYAAVAARLLQAAGKPTADVLGELGIDPDLWHASAATWERAVDDELARGQHALLVTFSASFAAARASLGRPSPPDLATPPAPTSPSPPSSPPSELLPDEPSCAPPPPPPLPAPDPDRVAIPDVPDVPIGPDTAAIDTRRLAQPALPFPSSAPPAHILVEDGATLPFLDDAAPTPPGGDGPRTPEPSPWVRLEPITARFDARWLPPPPEPAARPRPRAEAPMPLVRVKRRRRLSRWLAWLQGRLGLGPGGA